MAQPSEEETRSTGQQNALKKKAPDEERQWYSPRVKALASQRAKAKSILESLHALPQKEFKQRKHLLKQLFGQTGSHFYIESPFHCDYGKNITLGENFYANAGCTILDAANVVFGKNCKLGPNVGIYTSTHPLDAGLRAQDFEASSPVIIGDDVWIGGNATLLGGVEIGAQTVIGAGSVVTKSFGPKVVVAGNPARIIQRL